MQLKHWQTTTLGCVVILATLAHAAALYLTRQPLDYTTLLSGLAAGGALIRGADASKVNAIIDQLKKGNGK